MIFSWWSSAIEELGARWGDAPYLVGRGVATRGARLACEAVGVVTRGGEPLWCLVGRPSEFKLGRLVLPRRALNRRLPRMTQRDVLGKRIQTGSVEVQIARPFSGAACNVILGPYHLIDLNSRGRDG
jgi:hypothetical protein